MGAEEAVLHLVAALLPGGAGFPAATETGMGGVLLDRFRSSGMAGRLLATLTARGALPADPVAWTEAAAWLEAAEPRMFGELRKHAYLAYYEQPGVLHAIRALGHPYNDAPLPDGYPGEAFDVTRDAPGHRRGRWVDADAVRQVDLSVLNLAPPP